MDASETVRAFGADCINISLRVDGNATRWHSIVAVEQGVDVWEKMVSFSSMKEGYWQRQGFMFKELRLGELRFLRPYQFATLISL